MSHTVTNLFLDSSENAGTRQDVESANYCILYSYTAGFQRTMTDEAGQRKSTSKGECDWSVPYGLTELDMTAGVPDGTYDVVSADAEFAEEGRIGGVVVRNGEFDPKTTAEACYRAICVGCYGMGPRELAERPAIHHCFIERLYYDAEVSAFVLVTGS